jgi:hypothetical protein
LNDKTSVAWRKNCKNGVEKRGKKERKGGVVCTSAKARTLNIKIYEPWFFIFFGLFHVHRIWALIDRKSYSDFWQNVMINKDYLYFLIGGILFTLCLLGIITFFKNIKYNYWWRWIYIVGGFYLLFDLVAIVFELKFWRILLENMFDVNNVFWNIVWGFFILLGGFTFSVGIKLLRKRLTGF